MGNSLAQSASEPEAEKGVFLLFGGFVPTIIQSQVIAHIESMQRIGFDMEVWLSAESRDNYSSALAQVDSLSKQCDVTIRVFRGFRGNLPFSEVLNAALLLKLLHRHNVQPSFIHCRTEYAATVAALIKPLKNFRLIWDSRGDTASEHLLVRRNWSLFKRILCLHVYWSIRCRLAIADRCADVAIFVSQPLRKLHARRVMARTTDVIPCVAESTYFHFEPEMRSSVRSELGFGPADKVLLYSGSTAPWQCLPESIDLIEQLMRTDPSVKALILTPYVEKVQQYVRHIPKERVVIRSVAMWEVNRYLNAVDYGILLRRKDPINHVASPVKFAEYCLAGLPVIMTDGIRHVFTIGQRLRNSILYEFGSPFVLPCPLPDHGRRQIAEAAKQEVSRDSVLQKYKRIYSGCQQV